MAIATISTIFCVQQATGVDANLAAALTVLPQTIVLANVPIPGIDFILALPGVLGAIDAARSDPDNLYLTTITQSGRENAIWPAPGQSIDIQATQSVAPNFTLDFISSQNLSLWDYDSVSDDDLLGSVTMFASEQGLGEIAKLAASTIENSYYYVFYRVD
jgi:hypothetical protein